MALQITVTISRFLGQDRKDVLRGHRKRSQGNWLFIAHLYKKNQGISLWLPKALTVKLYKQQAKDDKRISEQRTTTNKALHILTVVKTVKKTVYQYHSLSREKSSQQKLVVWQKTDVD